MEQLPKIVRGRLQANAKPGVHPDPDLLTAFAENALAERERLPVLEHLSSCAACREVVSLAQPEFAIEQVAAVAASPAPSRPRWSSRLMFGWATVAACAVVGVVLLRYQTREKENRYAQIASRQAEPLSVGPPTNAAQPSNAPKPSAEAETDTEIKVQPATPAPQNELAAKLEAPALPESKLKTRADEARVNKDSVQGFAHIPARSLAKKLGAGTVSGQITGAVSARPSAPVQQGSEQVTVSGEVKEVISDQTASIDQKQAELPLQARSSAAQETSQDLAAADTPPAAQTENKPVSPNPASSSTASAGVGGSLGSGIGSGAAFARQKASVATAQATASQKLALARISSNYIPTRWTISPDGSTLLRSTDQGRSWDAVPVASNIVFRVVAALGPEVWVGGKGGALYHSSDLGAHWAQIKPTANGAALTADIVGIDFSDAQHGKLTTLDGKVWSTNDVGQNWQAP